MGAWIRQTWDSVKGTVLIGLGTLFIAACLRIFLFASFVIPTASMQPTLLPGDRILVNKLIPGPRLDWLSSSADIVSGDDYRIKGSRSISRGDILVFNAPYHHSKKVRKNLNVYYVKRCVGIPGDSLVIRGTNYVVKNGVDSLRISIPSDQSTYHIWMAHKPEMFKALEWTLTAFGPVYIPRKGEKIQLDSINIHLYKSLIEYETGEEFYVDDNAYLLSGRPYPAHVFVQNYYFMAGDFPMDSEDSRFWGLLPEAHVVGKAAYVWRSIDPDTKKHRFDRFLIPL